MNPPPIIWFYRLLYALVSFLLIAYPILPLQFSPDRWPAPELFFALTMGWIVRQPESAPFLLVAALALLADAVLMRPLGLWAFLLLIAAETLRFSAPSVQERGVVMEFTVVAGLLVAMVIVQNIVLWISFSQSLDAARMLQFVMLTLLCYPFMIAFMHYILRVRKPDHRNRPDRLGKIR